ncbi:MAG TPA: hypothetical protein VEU33_07825, partial [Archangium sp.]|nr:hypothetical protein [Archangium sp.]
YAKARAADGHGEATPWEGGSRRGWGLALTTLVGGVEMLPAVYLAIDGSFSEEGWGLAWILGVALTSFVPALLAGTGMVSSRSWLNTLLMLVVAVPALPWLASAALLVAGALASGALPWVLVALVPLGMGMLRAGGARLLFSPPTGEEPPKSQED